MPVVWEARPRLAPDRLLADFPAQTLESLAIDLQIVITLKNGSQTSTAKARVDQVNLVQYPLDADVFRILGDGLILRWTPEFGPEAKL